MGIFIKYSIQDGSPVVKPFGSREEAVATAGYAFDNAAEALLGIEGPDGLWIDRDAVLEEFYSGIEGTELDEVYPDRRDATSVFVFEVRDPFHSDLYTAFRSFDEEKATSIAASVAADLGSHRVRLTQLFPDGTEEQVDIDSLLEAANAVAAVTGKDL